MTILPLVPQLISVSQNFLSRHLLAKASPCMFIDSCQDAIQKRKKSHTHTKLNETLQYCEIDLASSVLYSSSSKFSVFKKCYYCRSVLTLILTSENVNLDSHFQMLMVTRCFYNLYANIKITVLLSMNLR